VLNAGKRSGGLMGRVQEACGRSDGCGKDTMRESAGYDGQVTDWSVAQRKLAGLSGRWVLPVLRRLAQGPHRPTELRGAIDEVSDKVLHETLDRLLDQGLIGRSPTPPQVTYALTSSGRDALRAADSIMAWSHRPDAGTSGPHRHEDFTWRPVMVEPSHPTPSIDTSTPSTARMYDYYLGGKDNFEADREAAEKAMSIYPEIRMIARGNRGFMSRAVRNAAESGIRQFIDLGTGIPTIPNVHEIARQTHADARVVYVDNDPIVSVHNRALRETRDGVIAIDADIRRHADVTGHPDVRRLIDFDQPVAVLIISVLHFFDDEDTHHLLTAFREQMAVGSHLVISTVTSDGLSPGDVAEMDRIYARAGTRALGRPRAEILRFFDGLELLDPGLTPVQKWRAEEPETTAKILGGVGRVTSP